MGWGLEFPFVERSYRSCSKDGQSTQDLCVFDMGNLSMVFGGRSTRLVEHSDGSWHPEDDTALRVERFEGAANGVWHGERWRVTTPDGTWYWFGSNAASAQDVSVYGDDVGEPCHSTYLQGSHCPMAYRWDLDEVVDRHGNTITYGYTEFRQLYGRYNGAEVGEYALYSVPTTIEYGRNPAAGVTTAAARVVLGNGPRCTEEPCFGDENTPKWYDTPWDLNCPLFLTSCDIHTPTFWWSVRLLSVTTQVRAAGGGWQDVDRLDLNHYFPGTWDSSSMSLWLYALDHTGLVGGAQATPRLDFSGTRMANRVDHDDAAGAPPLNKYRITSVVTNTGRETQVVYNPAECATGDLGVYHANIVKRCFPQLLGAGWAWFHKYTVASVTERDLIDFGYRGTREAMRNVAAGAEEMSDHGKDHLARFRGNWTRADQLICHSGYWTCSG